MGFIQSFFSEFQRIMLDGGRFNLILSGLKNTFVITFGALGIGIVIGIFVAAVRTSFDKNKDSLKLRGGVGYGILSALNAICKFYLTVTRGTPVVVQLMIAYFIIFSAANSGVLNK